MEVSEKLEAAVLKMSEAYKLLTEVVAELPVTDRRGSDLAGVVESIGIRTRQVEGLRVVW